MAQQPDRYFDDFPVGFSLETGSYTMTEDAIVAFAIAFDPQPFHTDPAAAPASVFGHLVASGWHTASVTMRLLVDSGAFTATGLVGLGVDEIRWPRPVLPGDTVRVRTTVLEATPSVTKPRGTIRWSVEALDQNDRVVMAMKTLTLFPKRP